MHTSINSSLEPYLRESLTPLGQHTNQELGIISKKE